MFRNREVRQFAILFLIIGTLTVILGFHINASAGNLALISAVAFGTVFFVFTKARYKSIARISHQIDLVLHDVNRFDFGELEEGELSILHNELTKMTSRIREQNDALKKEKEHLANSLADIAHQLRTPLTSANLTLSLLGNTSDEKEKKAFIRETEGLLTQMDWLITSLLNLSRLDAGVVTFQSEVVDIWHLINSALRPFLIPMELHNIELRIHVPNGITIQGDSRWLSEAIQNIIKNCMESTGENGFIEIVCEDTPLFTEMTIHDSGLGIDKEDLPCVFDRFYRGKSENASGYGIGLALCKMIITRQGGTVIAKNHPQCGAVFIIRFSK